MGRVGVVGGAVVVEEEELFSDGGDIVVDDPDGPVAEPTPGGGGDNLAFFGVASLLIVATETVFLFCAGIAEPAESSIAEESELPIFRLIPAR